MAPIEISEKEKQFILMLADRFLQGVKHVQSKDFPVPPNSDPSVASNLGRRYANLGILKCIGEPLYEIQDKVVEYAHQLNNPPLKDYWADIANWFRSKPWSVPVLLVLVCLPLLVQWVQMILYLLNWFVSGVGGAQ